MKRILSLFLFLLLLASSASAFEFDNVFSDQTVIEPMKYTSRDVSIVITKERRCDSDCYIAEIHVRSLESLRHGFPHEKWNDGVRKIGLMAKDAGALLAITGDYAKTLKAGIVYANGELKRKTPNNKRDLCVIYEDGVMDVLKGGEATVQRLSKEKAVWQTMLFGPNLFDREGKAIKTSNSKIRAKNPRAAVGYVEPGHYFFVVVDGRTRKNRGMTMVELAELMESIGCRQAYNLDGGQSALMWFNGSVLNTPYQGGRQLADMFYIAEP